MVIAWNMKYEYGAIGSYKNGGVTNMQAYESTLIFVPNQVTYDQEFSGYYQLNRRLKNGDWLNELRGGMTLGELKDAIGLRYSLNNEIKKRLVIHVYDPASVWDNYIERDSERFPNANQTERYTLMVKKGVNTLPDKVFSEKDDWHKNEHAVAFFQLTYLVEKEDFNSGRDISCGQMDGSVLVKLIAENRTAPGFRDRFDELFCIGDSSKRDDENSAGAHGEGIKMAANILVGKGYRVTVEANGDKREYQHEEVEGKMKLFALPKPSTTLPDDIITLSITKHPEEDFDLNEHTFDHSTFSILAPGVDLPEGKIATDIDSQGVVFIKGIRVQTMRTDILYGYYFPKVHIGRDRDDISQDDLKHELSKVWINQGNDMLFAILLQRLLKEKKPSFFLEYDAAFWRKHITKQLVKAFQKEKGADAYPCLKSEKERVSSLLKLRKGVVVNSDMADLFRTKGGYKDVDEELKTFYSKNNPSKMNIEGDPVLQKIIKHALLYLKDVGCAINENEIFFIDGSYLSEKVSDHYCKLIQNIYFIHDCLLKDTEEAAYMLGYHISSEVKSDCDEDLTSLYVRKGRTLSSCSISAFELENKILLELSTALLRKNPSIKTINAETMKPMDPFLVSEPRFIVPFQLSRGTLYRFVAVHAESGAYIHDDISGVLCSCELKTKGYTREDTASNTIKRFFRGLVFSARLARRARAANIIKRFFHRLVSSSRKKCNEASNVQDNATSSVNDASGNAQEDTTSKSESDGNYYKDDQDDTQYHTTIDADSNDDSYKDDPELLDGSDERVDEIFQEHHDKIFHGLPNDHSSKDIGEDNGPSQKRQKSCPPSEMNEVTVSGQTFIQGVWYYLPREGIYCRITKFGGVNKATNAFCDIRKPVQQTFAGSAFDSDLLLYVKMEEWVNLRTTWLLDMETFEANLPHYVEQPKFLYAEKCGSFEDADLLCSYQLLTEVPTPRKVPHKPNVLDIFAGVGGVSLGFEEAGFDLLALVEKNPQAAASLRRVHQSATTYAEDVNLFIERMLQGDDGYPRPEDIHHVHGSPPCQGNSTANRNKIPSAGDLENNKQSDLFLKAVDAAEPFTATMENVPGMAMPKNKARLDAMIHHLTMKSGYHVCVAIHNAKYYGVPQNRRRLVLYASKLGAPQLPERTHDSETVITVGEALDDLENIKPEPGCGLVESVNGEPIFNHCEGTKLTDQNRGDFKELDRNMPAPTLTTSRKFEHYSLYRSLTHREYARLQGFPDTMVFDGGTTAIMRQIGNAVPVGLSKSIGQAVIKSYRLYEE